MADFNHIFVDSTMQLTVAKMATLCFVDDLLISKADYTLENNILTLSNDPTDTISLFYNNGIATTYEFLARLYTTNTQMPTIDKHAAQVENLVYDKILVFIDGELQPKSAYKVIGTDILQIIPAYTTNPNKTFDVKIYSSTNTFIRQSLPTTTDLDYANIPYQINNTLVFLNGKKIPFNCIEIINTTHVKLNIPSSNISSLEYITIYNTSSVNFIASQGYISYGPYDDFNKKVPVLYDTILTFTDQVKLLIDNIRSGFIVKQSDGYGELLVIDTSFETTQIKCITLSQFNRVYYNKNEYYFEVPEYTSITKYLAEYDTRFTFLPEILTVFQRLLLDELNDSIERLRNIRSINKIDSININKLISLLGFNLNIKMLNKKQRTELLEELNEFYRIAGTKNSYNLINILQNNLKLINMEQLFTPHYPESREQNIIYNHTATVGQGGTGYIIGQYLNPSGYDNIILRVDNASTGVITAYSLETEESYSNPSGTYPVEAAGKAVFDITSIPNFYNYTYNLQSGTGHRVGQVLKTGDNQIAVSVTAIDSSGKITGFNTTPTGGVNPLTVNHSELYDVAERADDFILHSTDYAIDTTPYVIFTTGAESFDVTLPCGEYFFDISGGGGSGAAADSKHGGDNDRPADAGWAGERNTGRFTITQSTGRLTGKVGQGGGRVKARYHDYGVVQIDLGKGYQNGSLGNSANHINKSYACSGQGGGSTAILLNNQLISEARGGAGGRTQYGSYWNCAGGKGGGAATLIESNLGGAAGGARGAQSGSNKHWSGDGQNGWVKIYRVKQSYTCTKIDTTGVTEGLQYKIINANQAMTVTAHIQESTVTFTPSPAQEYTLTNGQYSGTLISAASTASYISCTSAPASYTYSLLLSSPTFSYLNVGDILKNTNSDPNKEFSFVVDALDNTTQTVTGHFYPISGTTEVSLIGAAAKVQVGTNATVVLTSAKNGQKNEYQEYIDFFTKEQLGAELKQEFRTSDAAYGTITEGTPNSPYFWIEGNPDIAYGLISTEYTEYISCGTITDEVDGEWVEWWEWDRKSTWYPTNHVELEMRLPVGVDFNDYTKIFIEQFYNLASTVVYIHRLIQSFFFGKETTDGSNLENNLGSFIGIQTGTPVMYDTVCVTSDPAIQYS